MAHNNYTWSISELYNKNGIQVLLIRCNEDNRKKRWEIVENGNARKVTHEEAAVYIDPDYKKRLEIKRKRIEACRKTRIARAGVEKWAEELQFSWV